MKPTLAERRKAAKLGRAFRRGIRAWHDGTRNPYKEFSIESTTWFRGYQASATIERYDRYGTQKRFILSREGEEDE